MTMVPFKVEAIQTGQVGTALNVFMAQDALTGTTHVRYDIEWDNGQMDYGVEKSYVVGYGARLIKTSNLAEIPLLKAAKTVNGPS